jgi:hypothetical protein
LARIDHHLSKAFHHEGTKITKKIETNTVTYWVQPPGFDVIEFLRVLRALRGQFPLLGKPLVAFFGPV